MSNDIGVAVIGAGMAARAHAHGYRSAGTVFSPGLPPVRAVSVADTARRYGFTRSDTFTDGRHALLLEEAIVHTATRNTPTPVTA